ncbi:hypothetical protein PHYNN_157 [Pantoea phage Phynn]|nr:hypothetical protein PHYNN_157 [Pantoea phage Phynn]
MKKVVIFDQKLQARTRDLIVGDRIDVTLYMQNPDPLEGENFVVQAVAKGNKAHTKVINALSTKGKRVIVITLDGAYGEHTCLVIDDAVATYDVREIKVHHYSSVDGFAFAVLSNDGKYEESFVSKVPVDLAPGMKLSTPNADYVVEYIAQDGSILFRSQKGPDHPVKTVHIGMKNTEFWKSVKGMYHMVDVVPVSPNKDKV